MAFFGSPDGAAAPPVRSDKLYVKGRAEPLWRRLPQPRKLHPWISEDEFEYFVKEFEGRGWDGGLNWYRALNVDWHATSQLQRLKVGVPTAFVAGGADLIVEMYGGRANVSAMMKRICAPPPDPIFYIEGAGHFLNQEVPNQVNDLLFKFLTKHRALYTSG